MNKRTLVGSMAAAIAVIFVMAACGNNAETPDNDGPVGASYGVVRVDVNGREVTCVTFDIYRGGGGISCNWDVYNAGN